jgi:division protein CdvB (Snf7/Vps24/ESCRT-III family)
MKIIPKKPEAEKPFKLHDLMRIYLHELRKCDQFRRRLRTVLGSMQNIEAKHFNHIVNAGIKNRPDIKYCIAKMHECGRRYF